jgi:DNA-binding CsgD family transcriptional regulator
MTTRPAQLLVVGFPDTSLSDLTDSKPAAPVVRASQQASSARRAANPINPRLAGGSSEPDQLLLDAFLGVRSRTRGPLVAVSDRTMITNASASELLQPAHRRLLWGWARRAIVDRRRAPEILRLSSTVTVRVRCRPVGNQARPLGAVVQLDLVTRSRTPGAPDDPSSGNAHVTQPVDPSLASRWVELTDAERTVAELVARGLTNKQAGRQMYLSHHTVDCYLRRIFQKLGLNSRVELARMVGEQYQALSDQSIAPAGHPG